MCGIIETFSTIACLECFAASELLWAIKKVSEEAANGVCTLSGDAAHTVLIKQVTNGIATGEGCLLTEYIRIDCDGHVERRQVKRAGNSILQNIATTTRFAEIGLA